ncbi:MAG: lipopolysaccharide biosynthesis protein [Candidatus Thiodiazotropha endolucinida]
MSLQKEAVRSVSWLALFKFSSQIISWVVTIVIARILLPDDYALSAMATIITGYAEIFSELGLGASIIQRKFNSRKNLASVFWFALFVSIGFAALCFPISYITADIFDEPQIIPLTQAVAILFIFSGLQVVPLNLLKRRLNFKMVGLIEMKCTIISSIGMVIIAMLGGGVWALVGGRIIRGAVKLILVYQAVKWRPLVHFDYSEAAGYLKFGILVAMSSSFFYLFQMSDRYFAGRAWSLTELGYYLFALQLSQLPTEKIVVLINQVSYPVLSKLQDNLAEMKSFYLNVIHVTSFLVLPIFVSGFLLGYELVEIILGEKWLPMTTLFEFLCLVQILTSLSAINSFVHMSKGKPSYSMYYYLILTLTMSVSYYIAVQYGMHAIIYPWISTYLVVEFAWIYFTMRRLDIKIVEYFRSVMHPLTATICMVIGVLLYEQHVVVLADYKIADLLTKIVLSMVIYFAYIYTFNRKILTYARNMIRRKG